MALISIAVTTVFAFAHGVYILHKMPDSVQWHARKFGMLEKPQRNFARVRLVATSECVVVFLL